jgi:hypothetical protein
MKAELTIIPQISIHPSQVNFYYQYHWNPCRPNRSDNSDEYFAFVNEDGTLYEYKEKKHQHLLDSTRTANGRISKTAKRKMNKAVDYLLLMANEKTGHSRFSGRFFKFKIAFITLTLPSKQKHDDREIINKCLNQFLIEIKKYYHVKNYVWRAEKQAQGNIHFHLLIDRFIPWQELRDRWNRIIEKLEYVSNYRENQMEWHKNGFRVRKELLKTWPEEKQKKAYNAGAKSHWNSPNSTDIHSIQKIHNIKKYISKYMTKPPEPDTGKNSENSEETIQTGRVWGCNREISNPKGARTDVDNQLQIELEKLENDPEIHSFKDEYFSCYYINATDLQQKGLDNLFKLFSAYMFEMFGHPMQTTMPVAQAPPAGSPGQR